MMIFINEAYKQDKCYRKLWEPFVLLLAPYAPHLSEEMWAKLGHTGTLAYEAWPKWVEELTKDDEKEVVVQINGKVRCKMTLAAGTDPEAMKAAAQEQDRVKELTEGKQIVKIIAIPDKLVNIVIRG